MVKAPAFVILRLSPFTASQICERYVGHSDLSNPALECQIKLVPNQSGETCLQNRVDEGKFSGGLIRRVASGEENGGEGFKCGCTPECGIACPRKTHIPATRPLLLLTAREKSSIKEIEANSRQTINKSQSGTFPLRHRQIAPAAHQVLSTIC